MDQQFVYHVYEQLRTARRLPEDLHGNATVTLEFVSTEKDYVSSHALIAH